MIYFASLVSEDDHFPLTEAAIAIAQHAYPDLVVQHVFDELDLLGDKLKQRTTHEMAGIQKLQILKNFFFKELGFGPNRNDYYDPNNSYLHSVLETRRGIPISLALVFMELGQQIGLNIKGVSFPNHFMVRLSLPQGEVILDPLTGTSLSKEELQQMLDPYLDAQGYRGEYQLPLSAFLRSSSSREILSRFLRNLKAIYTQQERWERLLGVQQRLVILLPDALEEIRDRGIALAQLDYIRPAIEDMQKYLDGTAEASDLDEIRAQIDFTGVFIPADRTWSEQLCAVGVRGLRVSNGQASDDFGCVRARALCTRYGVDRGIIDVHHAHIEIGCAGRISTRCTLQGTDVFVGARGAAIAAVPSANGCCAQRASGVEVALEVHPCRATEQEGVGLGSRGQLGGQVVPGCAIVGS